MLIAHLVRLAHSNEKGASTSGIWLPVSQEMPEKRD